MSQIRKTRAEYMREYRKRKSEETAGNAGAEMPKRVARNSTQRNRDHRARKARSIPSSISTTSTSTAPPNIVIDRLTLNTGPSTSSSSLSHTQSSETEQETSNTENPNQMEQASHNSPEKTNVHLMEINDLALRQKVAAICRFEVTPVYRSVANYFNCSANTIKRIIKQKDEILKEWDNRKNKVSTVNEKSSILSRAIYEWIRRMMFYTDFSLTNSLLQIMALEFRKILGLQNFFPTRSWIAKFQSSYNLKEVCTRVLDIGYKEGKSMKLRDILKYVQDTCDPSIACEKFGKTVESNQHTASKKAMINDEAMTTTQVYIKEDSFSVLEVGEEKLLQPSCSASLSTTKDVPSSVAITRIESESPDPISRIILDEEEATVLKTQEEAINYVKLLEEFALLKADFRLIGLIERLEEELKKN